MTVKHTRFIVRAAIIGALYVVLTLAFAPLSFGPIQFRVSEMLTILPYFTPAAIPGLLTGCLIANIYSGLICDIIFGSLTTLVAAILSYALRKYKFLVPFPPVILNALVLPFIFKYAYMYDDAVWFMMLTVGAGQIVSCYGLGLMLIMALNKFRKPLFGE